MPDYIDFKFSSSEYNENTFEVVRFTGDEAISSLYSFEIEVATTALDIDDEKMLKGRAQLSIALGPEKRIWRGIVSDIQAIRHVDGLSFYQIKLVPIFWNLSLYVSNEIYLSQPIDETIQQVLKSSGFTDIEYDFQLVERYPAWDFRCQYEESNLNFLSRVMERDGLYYYFKQDEENEKLVITDSNMFDRDIAEPNLIYQPMTGMEVEQLSQSIQSFVGRRERMPQTVTLRDYNDEKPSVDITASATVDDNGIGEVNVFGQNIKTVEEGQRLAQIRAEEIRSQKIQFFGESTAFRLQPGYRFHLTQHFKSAYNAKYLICSVKHEGVNPRFQSMDQQAMQVTYSNQFSVIPAGEQFRAKRETKKPEVYGNMNAIIDAEGDGKYAELDSNGRYKVSLPFDRQVRKEGKASHWIRMSQPFGGREEGMHFPLRKGARVLLSFIDGDPDRPFITGTLPTDSQPSIVSGDNQTNSVIKTASGNKIEIEDQEDKNRIKLSTGDNKSYMHLGAPNHDGDGLVILTEGIGRFEFLGGFTGTAVVKDTGLAEYPKGSGAKDDIRDLTALANRNWSQSLTALKAKFSENLSTFPGNPVSSSIVRPVNFDALAPLNFSSGSSLQRAVLEYMSLILTGLDTANQQEIDLTSTTYNKYFALNSTTSTYERITDIDSAKITNIINDAKLLLEFVARDSIDKLQAKNKLNASYEVYVEKLAELYTAEQSGIANSSQVNAIKESANTLRIRWKVQFNQLVQILDGDGSGRTLDAVKEVFPAYADDFESATKSTLATYLKTQLFRNEAGTTLTNSSIDSATNSAYEIVKLASDDSSINSNTLTKAKASSLVTSGQHIIGKLSVKGLPPMSAPAPADFIWKSVSNCMVTELGPLSGMNESNASVIDSANPTSDTYDEQQLFKFPALDKDANKIAPSADNSHISPSGFLTREGELSGDYIIRRELGKKYVWHYGSIMDFGRNSNLYDFGPSFTLYQSKDWDGTVPDDIVLYRRWNYEVKIAAIANDKADELRSMNLDFNTSAKSDVIAICRKLLAKFSDYVGGTFGGSEKWNEGLPPWVYLLAKSNFVINDEIKKSYLSPNPEPWIKDSEFAGTKVDESDRTVLNSEAMNGVEIYTGDAVVDKVIGDYYGFKYGKVREIWVGDFDEEYYGDYRELRRGDTTDSHYGNDNSTHYGDETSEHHGNSTEIKHGGTHTSEYQDKTDGARTGLESTPRVVTKYGSSVYEETRDSGGNLVEEKKLECESKGFREIRFHPETGGTNSVSHTFQGGLVNFETQLATQFNMNTVIAPLSTTINNGPALGLEINLAALKTIINTPLWMQIEAGPGPQMKVDLPGLHQEYKTADISWDSVSIGSGASEIKSSGLNMKTIALDIAAGAFYIGSCFKIDG